MATSTALGLLILLGLRPGSILCITPFLILAIGISFLLIVSIIINGSFAVCSINRTINLEEEETMKLDENLCHSRSR